MVTVTTRFAVKTISLLKQSRQQFRNPGREPESGAFPANLSIIRGRL
jgi:hypothetical protein